MSTRDERVLMHSLGFKFIRIKSGRLITFWDARRAAERAESALHTAVSRAVKLAEDDWDLERVEWLLEGLDTYLHHVLQHIEELRGVKTQDRLKETE